MVLKFHIIFTDPECLSWQIHAFVMERIFSWNAIHGQFHEFFHNSWEFHGKKNLVVKQAIPPHISYLHNPKASIALRLEHKISDKLLGNTVHTPPVNPISRSHDLRKISDSILGSRGEVILWFFWTISSEIVYKDHLAADCRRASVNACRLFNANLFLRFTMRPFLPWSDFLFSGVSISKLNGRLCTYQFLCARSRQLLEDAGNFSCAQLLAKSNVQKTTNLYLLKQLQLPQWKWVAVSIAKV